MNANAYNKQKDIHGYLGAQGNLSLINHPEGMAGDGIRPSEFMMKALSMKQEPVPKGTPRIYSWEDVRKLAIDLHVFDMTGHRLPVHQSGMPCFLILERILRL